MDATSPGIGSRLWRNGQPAGGVARLRECRRQAAMALDPTTASPIAHTDGSGTNCTVASACGPNVVPSYDRRTIFASQPVPVIWPARLVSVPPMMTLNSTLPSGVIEPSCV